MNKRQFRKRVKKVNVFCGLEDVYCKCFKCQNFESGDMSVGLQGGCIADFLFDKDDNIIGVQDDKAYEYMSAKGYICPYFLKTEGKDINANLPKTYREYRTRLKELNRLYELYCRNMI